jgi:hypothetical protein
MDFNQGPGMYKRPRFVNKPRKYGIFSLFICILEPVNPINSICLIPVIASVKLTSMVGFVSKLSDKLQQAAFLSSFSDITAFR